MRLPLLLLVTVALGLAACRPVPPAPNPLAETGWELRALVQGGDSLSNTGGLPADLLYFEADGGIRVRSCNLCTGLYVLSDLHVVVRNLACTRRACPADRLELDRYVAGRARYRLQGDWLLLDVDDEINRIEARLYFAPLPPGAWEGS
jgi:heat shock protein HslJ